MMRAWGTPAPGPTDESVVLVPQVRRVGGLRGGRRVYDLNFTNFKREYVFQGWWACARVFGGQLLRESSLNLGEAFAEG